MKFLFCLTLGLLSCQSMMPSAHRHWCDQPIHKLRWLKRMIQEIGVFPTAQNTWEVHQAHYWGQEVFIVHLFGQDKKGQGFFLYNHAGELISTWKQADSVHLADLIGDRTLVANTSRFQVKDHK